MGNQIMVGFIAKTKTESVNRNPEFLFWRKTSFKIIKENTITGKSVDGDWEKRNSKGKKSRWIQNFFSKT